LGARHVEATIITTTFDLWMSQKNFDIFVFVVNYTNKKWQSCHIIMGFLSMIGTMGATMVM
jgi:hypothetical protein